MDKTPVFYFDWLKEQYPDTLKYASYSNDIELYYGFQNVRDLHLKRIFDTGSIQNYYSSGGVLRNFSIEDEGHIDNYEVNFLNHRKFNSKVYLNCRNVRDVLNDSNSKYILHNNNNVNINDFIEKYGRKIIIVDSNGEPYHNMYNPNYNNWNPSMFYESKEDINLNKPLSVIVKSGNLIFPLFSYEYYNQIIPPDSIPARRNLNISVSNYVELIGSIVDVLKGIIIGYNEGINYIQIGDVVYEIPYKRYNDTGKEEFILENKHEFIENNDSSMFNITIEPSLYKDKLSTSEQFFYFSGLENFGVKVREDGTIDFTNLNYSMLYTKESIEEYLRAFGIDFEWVYDVVGDDDFVQGRKVRHPSLINQPATLEFSKQRHQSLINQPATQAVKKVRHIL